MDRSSNSESLFDSRDLLGEGVRGGRCRPGEGNPVGGPVTYAYEKLAELAFAVLGKPPDTRPRT